jgi:hypothetical protein
MATFSSATTDNARFVCSSYCTCLPKSPVAQCERCKSRLPSPKPLETISLIRPILFARPKLTGHLVNGLPDFTPASASQQNDPDHQAAGSRHRGGHPYQKPIIGSSVSAFCQFCVFNSNKTDRRVRGNVVRRLRLIWHLTQFRGGDKLEAYPTFSLQIQPIFFVWTTH